MPGGERFSQWSVRFVMAAFSALLGLAAFWTPRVEAANAISFPCPASLQPKVKFWTDVFATYTERDFIVHDRDHLSRIYEVMHLPGDGMPSRQEVDAVDSYLKTKYGTILNRLASGAQPSDYEEQRVAAMFKGQPLSAYTLAADNLRVQQGMRERFKEGLLRSRYYRSEMERIFASFGLPPELVTLAEVESGFYSRARSNAGAVGIWQFTRDTGHQYMRISRYHDDRLDPITETRAAAELLRANYDELGSWPLAITAYNYGTAGMAHAASLYDSDYARILRDYDGPHFGFAAKNYYAEFLAALQVHQNEDKYFPDLKYLEAPPPPPVQTDFPRPHLVRRFHHHHRRHLARHRHRRRVIAMTAPSSDAQHSDTKKAKHRTAAKSHSATHSSELASAAHKHSSSRRVAHRITTHKRNRRLASRRRARHQRQHPAVVADSDGANNS